jgi:hypothetical protein
LQFIDIATFPTRLSVSKQNGSSSA